MVILEQLFLESKGQPINFEGQIIQLVDKISIKNDQMIKVFFESTNSKWKQGIRLYTEGNFTVNGLTIANSVVLWEDNSPEEVEIHVRTKKGECIVNNVWDTGNGVMQSWHNCAAMIVEENGHSRRYKCNDGFNDADFDDLVFKIQLIN